MLFIVKVTHQGHPDAHTTRVVRLVVAGIDHLCIGPQWLFDRRTKNTSCDKDGRLSAAAQSAENTAPAIHRVLERKQRCPYISLPFRDTLIELSICQFHTTSYEHVKLFAR
jgi:hypothetical protein